MSERGRTAYFEQAEAEYLEQAPITRKGYGIFVADDERAELVERVALALGPDTARVGWVEHKEEAREVAEAVVDATLGDFAHAIRRMEAAYNRYGAQMPCLLRAALGLDGMQWTCEHMAETLPDGRCSECWGEQR